MLEMRNSLIVLTQTNNMKKLKYLMMAFVTIMLSASFSSCGGSDDGEKENPDTQESSFTYSLTVNEDLLSLADVTIYYIDTEGVEKSEKLSTTTWSKTFTANKFNVSAGMTVVPVMKTGISSTKDSYNLKCMYSYTVDTKTNGTITGHNSSSMSTGMSAVKWDGISSTISSLVHTIAMKVDANGEVSTTTLSWKEKF